MIKDVTIDRSDAIKQAYQEKSHILKTAVSRFPIIEETFLELREKLSVQFGVNSDIRYRQGVTHRTDLREEPTYAHELYWNTGRVKELLGFDNDRDNEGGVNKIVLASEPIFAGVKGILRLNGMYLASGGNFTDVSWLPIEGFGSGFRPLKVEESSKLVQQIQRAFDDPFELTYHGHMPLKALR